jgi:hypothetical protein
MRNVMAAKKKAKTRSSADIAKAWRKLEPELARRRAEHERQGGTFKSITREEFEAKMKRVNSPMIVGLFWFTTAPPGGTLNYQITIINPDPIHWYYLAVSVSIGNRNTIANNTEFLTAFDARFPTYAQPAANGFDMAPNTFNDQSFQISIPAGIEKTGYFANTVLQQISFFDVGKFLDRACIFFDVA